MEIPRTLGMACYCCGLRETQISGDAAWLQCMTVVRDSSVWLWLLAREKRTVGFFVVIFFFLRESVSTFSR